MTIDVLRATGNPDVKFLHCLQAFHDLGTKVGREIQTHGLDSLEVTDEVFESALRSSSTRPRTGCTPSRRSWSPPWPTGNPRGPGLTEVPAGLILTGGPEPPLP